MLRLSLQIKKAKWFADGSPDQHENPLLQVKVYLDFESAYGERFGRVPPQRDGTYLQAEIDPKNKGDLYRDVAYVPVLVWRGDKGGEAGQTDDDGATSGSVQLVKPQTMAFGQYGVPHGLPWTAKTFESLNWSVAFSENGEVTSANFATKAIGVSATALFGTAASTASSIASEERNAATAAGPESQAQQFQGQSDLIYQTQRFALCEADAKSCSSK